jgi:hypothetical protein
MKNLSAYDQERLTHINFLMENINELTSDIYESLVDREFDELKTIINKLMSQLNDIQISLEDEI